MSVHAVCLSTYLARASNSARRWEDAVLGDGREDLHDVLRRCAAALALFDAQRKRTLRRSENDNLRGRITKRSIFQNLFQPSVVEGQRNHGPATSCSKIVLPSESWPGRRERIPQPVVGRADVGENPGGREIVVEIVRKSPALVDGTPFDVDLNRIRFLQRLRIVARSSRRNRCWPCAAHPSGAGSRCRLRP